MNHVALVGVVERAGDFPAYLERAVERKPLLALEQELMASLAVPA